MIGDFYGLLSEISMIDVGEKFTIDVFVDAEKYTMQDGIVLELLVLMGWQPLCGSLRES